MRLGSPASLGHAAAPGMQIDHIVLWVADPLRSVEFYQRVLGLEGVRVDAFKAGKAPFPSVRVSAETIIDLMPKTSAGMLNTVGRKHGLEIDAAGHPVHHVCLSMSEAEFEALRARLEAEGQDTSFGLQNSFGAGGHAPRTFYFADPDGNVLEARYY